MHHGHGGAAHSNEHHHGKPDRNLHDVISTLTHLLTGLGKDGSGGSGTSERGMGIVTLAGSNKGAVMKADLLDEAMEADAVGVEKGGGEEGKLSAYTNSNYQAVNNSIMIDGRCETEDPGVHIEIVDCVGGDGEDEGGDGGESSDDEHEKKTDKKKKKKKEKEKKKKEKKEKKEKKGSSHEEKEGNGSGSE